MKTLSLVKLCVAGCLVGWLSVHSAMAADKNEKPKKPGKESKETVKPANTPPEKSKEQWVDVKISGPEREVITTYVQSYEQPKKPGKKPKDLPPGLQKKIARGGQLPPGWEKKMVQGEIMPVEVYKECHPLPPELVVKLPPPPKGVITVTIGGKIVRLMEATREILDIFEVGR
ncbi:MAG: hypothetical protein K0Q55_3103 [Verrucomicrobia bacterium]|jgi:hypothetical protein|nr:hypothetical protein [Verrucomicrobiota bacterium]